MSSESKTTYRFTNEQLSEMDARLYDAEKEWREAEKIGKANELINLNASHWLRLLLNEVMDARAQHG